MSAGILDRYDRTPEGFESNDFGYIQTFPGSFL